MQARSTAPVSSLLLFLLRDLVVADDDVSEEVGVMEFVRRSSQVLESRRRASSAIEASTAGNSSLGAARRETRAEVPAAMDPSKISAQRSGYGMGARRRGLASGWCWLR